MPKLRQPCSLRVMSFNVLLEYAVRCCEEQMFNESLEKLRRSVASIKENICRLMPRKLLTKFCNDFLNQVYMMEHPQSYNKALSEIIMDSGISELKLKNFPLLEVIDPSDVRRLRGLEILHIELFRIEIWIPTDIKNSFLADLTELHYVWDCDDTHLELIGKNCLKLRELDVLDAQRITDRGLRSLNQLSELRSFSISLYPEITLDIIYEFLFVHKKIEKMRIFPNYDFDDEITYPQFKSGMAIFPSVKYLAIPLKDYNTCILRSIVFMFPNLTSIEFHGHVSGDLRILETLDYLSVLDFTHASGLLGANLNQFLILKGNNITELRLRYANHVTQNDLNVIHKYCPKIETLIFSLHRQNYVAEVLAIPPFKELNRLHCYIEDKHSIPPQLEFGELSMLESLSIEYGLEREAIKEIILDDQKFPNLKRLAIPKNPWTIRLLNKIVKYRNLDIKIMDVKNILYWKVL